MTAVIMHWLWWNCVGNVDAVAAAGDGGDGERR